MARYRALSFIPFGGHSVAEGETFESDAVPGLAWEPLDKEAKAAVKAATEDREARIAAARAAKAAKLGGGVVKPADEFEQAWLDVSAERDALAVELADAITRGTEALNVAHEQAEAYRERIAELEAAIAPLDGDKDGKPGGSKPAEDKK